MAGRRKKKAAASKRKEDVTEDGSVDKDEEKAKVTERKKRAPRGKRSAVADGGDVEEDSVEAKEAKASRRGRKGKATSASEAGKDVQESGSVTILDEWRKENTKKMLSKADRATQLRAELKQLEMQEQGSSKGDIDDAIEAVLHDAGLNEGEYDAQKAKYARQAVTLVPKLQPRGNFSVWIKKIENALDGAVNEKTKVTLALTRMEDELKEILQGMAKSDTWFNWKKEAAQILQADRNIHERLSKVRALAMEPEELPSAFLARFIKTLTSQGIWDTLTRSRSTASLLNA